MEPYVSNRLKVRVDNRQVGGMLFGQQALLVGHYFGYNETTSEPEAYLDLRVYLHELKPDGELGARLDGAGFVFRPFRLHGKNDTIVDATNPASESYGNMLAQRQVLADGVTSDPAQDWQGVQEAIRLQGIKGMLQGNFFEHVNSKVPILAESQQVKHILTANALGYFA